MQCTPYCRALASVCRQAAGCALPLASAGWWSLTKLLLVVLLAAWVPNLWVHLVRRVRASCWGCAIFGFTSNERSRPAACLVRGFFREGRCGGRGCCHDRGAREPARLRCHFPACTRSNEHCSAADRRLQSGLAAACSRKSAIHMEGAFGAKCQRHSATLSTMCCSNGYALVSLPEELGSTALHFREAQKFSRALHETKLPPCW